MRPNGSLRVGHGTLATTFPAHYAKDLDIVSIKSKSGFWTCPYHHLTKLVSRGKMMGPIWKVEFYSWDSDDNGRYHRASGKGSIVLFEHRQPVSLKELLRRLAPLNIPKHFVRVPNESATPSRGQ